MKIDIDKYTYRVQWSQEDGCHVAKCLEFPSLSAHGRSAIEALQEIENVVLYTIEWMEENGESIPEPYGLKKYKGNLSLRVPTDIHRELAIRSAEQGVSLNQYILSKI